MKKPPVSLLCLPAFSLLASAAIAQDLTSRKGETMLPEEGDYAIGFDADPFLNYVGNFLNSGGAASSPTSQPFTGAQSSLVGKMFKDAQTAYRGRVRLGFGKNGSIYGDPFVEHSAVYGDLRVDVPVRVTDRIRFDFGLQETLFDSGPIDRSGSDDWIHGYNLRSVARFNLCCGVFDAESEIYHGGFSSLSLGDISSGIAFRDRTLYRGNYQFTYRFDDGNPGDAGWEYQTGVQSRLYNESGESAYDTTRFIFSQSANYRCSSGSVFWNRVSYRIKDWDDMNDWDSDGIRFSSGLSGELGNGIGYRVGVSVEERDYDGADDRTVIGAEAAVYGSHYDWDWKAFADHGIQDRNITNGSQGQLADARGLRCGATAEREISDDLLLSLWFQDLQLNSSIGGGDLESHFVAGGVSLEKRLCERSSVGAAVELQRIEYKSPGSTTGDTSENCSIFYNYQF